MKLTEVEDQIYVMKSSTNAAKVLQTIAESGVKDEAFYILDIGTIIHKHHEWLSKLPRVKPHYAVKCNDNILVLETLAALGVGFDCASKGELNKVLSLGVAADRIIFANPAKPASHIRHAASLGVGLMTFDNETELHKVKELHPDAKLVVRIRCDAAVSQCPLGMKFGCDAILEAPHLMKLANSLGLEIVGVSFHVGSGCQDPPVFRKAISLARGLFDLGFELGFNMHLLDLGGGFPGDSSSSIDRIADIINLALEDYFPPQTNIEIIAEPGRFYVASAFTLATNIHSKREIYSTDKELLHTMYYINDGIYGSFNCILFDHYTPTPIPLTDSKSDQVFSCSLWGPTCDALDRIIENSFLPKMNIGDWIIFPDMGAYTVPVASTFNGFPIPKVYAVVDEKIWPALKDCAPLTDDHFAVYHSPASFGIGDYSPKWPKGMDSDEFEEPHPYLLEYLSAD
ncbi:unnamed protein product [Bemisia tabaci]|uniref:ornithine decarboxylase n=2 Tax=Bemisia tabaci TaxID=7038 RepID=A0A9P0A5P4_BEMTA|nr:unnamed protein product [Bemisia tabaci]